ncbi:FecR family protein [Sphingobacterium sp. lm-10]|uniref:FecR family protein n=1 Tax=Sphingobacterium sp. lm-10 TaxID=2944904 RepID=UPI0020223E3D|nr:FecR family protein [Sphingobacterium sp. lm-10]MCL7987831.1 FecR family protein [Sphingobacterium sp. lm-10]
MHQEKKEFIDLVQKQIDETITQKESIRLKHLSIQIPELEQAALFEIVWDRTIEKDKPLNQPFSSAESHQLFHKIIDAGNNQVKPRKKTIPSQKIVKWISTAAALILISFGVKFMYSTHSNEDVIPQPFAQKHTNQQDVEPGRNRALFLTEDGEQIALDSNQVGIIEAGETFSIVRLETGEIQYTNSDNTQIEQHTVKTPRGGQINFLLPDGTKVWLNAESSIRFASNLGTADRVVHMTGEVYFEVTKSEGRNFLVQGQFGAIEVLGTKFNVNAYDKNLTTAALLSGAIRLETATGAVQMSPNQLTTIAANGNMKTAYNPNVKDMTRWKDGYFHFDRADVSTIASQLERWYDIDVKITGKRKHTAINGTISRNVKLSKMLEMLDYLGLQSSYKNNNLTVNIKNP